MSKQLTNFVKALPTAKLVELYNFVQPAGAAPVKKFADRATAEKRMARVMATWDGATIEAEGYENFFADFAVKAAKAGFELPQPESAEGTPPVMGEPLPVAASKFGTKPKSAAIPKPAKATASPKRMKDKAGNQQFNLRCEAEGCAFFAKTNKASLALGRLKCPVHNKVLLTKEERGEKRGIPQGAKANGKGASA